MKYRLLPYLTSLLVASVGFVSLAQVLTVHVRHHEFGRIDDSLLPFTTAHYSRLFILGLGIVLLYLSLQIARRKRIAFILVTIGLVGLIGAELFDVRNSVQLVFYIVTLGLLLVTRKQYVVAINNLSLRRGAGTAIAIIVIVFLYGTLGFARLGVREIGTKISLLQAAKFSAREIFTFQESSLPLHSRHARWFVDSVNIASGVAYTLAFVSLFRPLAFRYGASRHDRQLAENILRSHGVSTEDFFKLWPPDKHYFFSSTRDGFVAYKVVGRDAMILGGPSGKPGSFPQLMKDFTEFCARSGWLISVISAAASFEDTVDKDAYQRVFIGNEAIIDINDFATETYRSKHFRYIRNRAERDGLIFEYWPAPLSEAQVTELRRISDSWLDNRSRREYTFALGYFDTEYIRSCDIAIILHNGNPIAYANVLPSFGPTARSIDHMRYTPALPSTGMHYLLLQLILCLHTSGVRQFNLGLAPLSGIESLQDTSVPEKLLAVLKKLGGAYYSFEGLEQFKNKFDPFWEPRYIYYQGSPARLLGLTRSFTRAVSMPVVGRKRRLTIIVMSIIAAVGYSSFPLAYFISPGKVLNGFASELGSSGQAYAGLFNGLDIASSLLMFIIAAYLWARLSLSGHLARILLLCFALAALGNLLAAVTPLPVHTSSTIQLALHDICSALNILGICGAALCLVLYAQRQRWLSYLLALLFITIALSVLFQDRFLGDAAQRCQIVLTGIWIIIISTRLSQSAKHTRATADRT